MDEKVVFGNTPPTSPQQGNTNPPSQSPSQGQKITLNDLYGSSQPNVTQQVPAQPQTTQQTPLAQPTPEAPERYTQPITPPVPPQMQSQQMQSQAAATPMQPNAVGAPPPSGIAPANPPPPSFPKSLLQGRLAKFAIAGVGILFILLLIGFIGSRFSSGGTTPAGEVTLTYWGLWEDPKTMALIIDEFERENPNIKIAYTKQDLKKYKDRVTTRIPNGSGPDVYTYHNTWLPTLTTMLLPLSNDVISPDTFKKTYFPVTQTDLVSNGAIYGIPQGIDTLSLFINKEIFDAAGILPPQTWEEFMRTAKQLTVLDDNRNIRTAGAGLGTYDNVQHASDIVSLLMLQNGVNLSTFSNHSAQIVEALIFYTSFARGTDGVWNERSNPSLLAFSNGELAMYFGYSWDIFMIQAANAKLAFEVHPVPNLPGKQTSIASYWVNGISSKSKHQQEALLFMKFLAEKDTAQKLYTEAAKTRGFGTPYARIDLAETLQDHPFLGPIIAQAPYAQSTYFASDTEDTGYNVRLNAYLGNSIRSILANDSPETAANTLMQGVSQVRSQYGL